MKQNSNVLTDCISETPRSIDVPIWTIPDAPLPSTNKDIDPPKYNEVDNLPPNYFDISIVPNNVVLHYNEVIPYTEPSQAKIERKTEGILSLDPLIDRNPDQLWLYFMTYLNEKPCLSINIHGYHIQYYTTYEIARRPNGETYTRAVSRTRNVTDFSYSIDLEPYICNEWCRIAVIPSKKSIGNGKVISLRDAIEQYTRSEKNIKEIKCEKQLIGWNFEEVKHEIEGLVCSTGYRDNICINFVPNNHRIVARSSSKLSRFSNSLWTRVLCVLSCLWLIFVPIYLCLRNAGSIRDRIVADYKMISSADRFLQMNAGVIVNAVIHRSTKRYLATIV